MLSVSDGVLTGSLDISNITTVAHETGPGITGTAANQALEDIQTLNPFANVVVADPDFGSMESVSIMLVNANGSATDADGTLSGTGLTKTATGTYRLAAATPTAVTTELEQLLFTPVVSSQRVITTLDLAVSDGTD